MGTAASEATAGVGLVSDLGVGADGMAVGALASGAEGSLSVAVAIDGAIDGAISGVTVDGGTGAAAGSEVAGFTKTKARTTRLTANSPSRAHTHDGVLPLERSAEVGSVDGFC